jgi:hypothetical protein
LNRGFAVALLRRLRRNCPEVAASGDRRALCEDAPRDDRRVEGSQVEAFFTKGDQALLQYQLYWPTKSGAEIGIINADLGQMAEAAREIADYTNKLVRLFHRRLESSD